MKKAVLALVALTVVGLGGCSGGSDNAGIDPFGDVPKCSDVWKVGATLALNDYSGCIDGDNYEIGMSSGCYDENSNYRGQVATFDDRLWVLQTGTDSKTGKGGTPGEITDVLKDHGLG